MEHFKTTSHKTMRAEPKDVRELPAEYTVINNNFDVPAYSYKVDVRLATHAAMEVQCKRDWYVHLEEHLTTNAAELISSAMNSEIPKHYLETFASISEKVNLAICKFSDALSEIERTNKRQRLLSSMAEISRYIPELSKIESNFFVDDQTDGVGVTIKKDGTLSLLVDSASQVKFSYASKAEFGGLCRITGTAKMTKDYRNSDKIKLLLNLLENK